MMRTNFIAFVRRYFIEIATTTSIILALQLAVWSEAHQVPEIYIVITVLGGILVFLQSLLISKYFSRQLPGKFSDLLHRQRLRARIGLYYLLPLVFYASIALYIFQIKNPLLREISLFIYAVALLINTINMRESYTKHFSLARHTRVIFNVIDILIYYFSVAVLFDAGVSTLWLFVGMASVMLLLLLHQLMLHTQINVVSLLILGWTMTLSLIATYLVTIYFADALNANIWKAPLYATNIFFVAIYLWSVRFRGHYGKAYISALLNGLLNMVLIYVL